jgi:hypothetical protein
MTTRSPIAIIALFVANAAAVALVGCNSPSAPPGKGDVQQQILNDPMGYQPDLRNNVDDSSGFNRDLQDVFGP